jgi:hypothetical protein
MAHARILLCSDPVRSAAYFPGWKLTLTVSKEYFYIIFAVHFQPDQYLHKAFGALIFVTATVNHQFFIMQRAPTLMKIPAWGTWCDPL